LRGSADRRARIRTRRPARRTDSRCVHATRSRRSARSTAGTPLPLSTDCARPGPGPQAARWQGPGRSQGPLRRSWAHEQRRGGESYLVGRRSFTEEGAVLVPDLEAQARTVAIARHPVVRTRVANVADHLSTIDATTYGDAAGDAGEMTVPEHRPLGCLQPHLATAEPVELLVARAGRDVLE